MSYEMAGSRGDEVMIPLDPIGIYDVEPEDCDFCVDHVEEDQGRNPPFFKMCKRHQAKLGKVVTRLNMAGYGPQMQR